MSDMDYDQQSRQDVWADDQTVYEDNKTVSASPLLRHALEQRYLRAGAAAALTRRQSADERILLLLGRAFQHQDPGAYLARLTIEERVNCLERFAEALAKEMRIPWVKLEFTFDLTAVYCGSYRFTDGTALLNASYLYSDDPVALRDVVDTVLHEMRHGQQNAAMRGRMPDGYFTAEQIKAWLYGLAELEKNRLHLPVPADNALEGDAIAFASAHMRTYLYEGPVRLA